jgi:hypothetical protein
MKLNLTRKKPGEQRAPLINFVEASELFKVSPAQLRVEVPEAVFMAKRHVGGIGTQRSYYRRHEMLAWRKAFLESKLECA